MSLYIYTNVDGINEAVFGVAIASDISLLWSGKDFETFTKETGLNQSQVLGLIIKDNKLVFDQAVQDAALYLQRPIARGKDFIKFIRQSIRTKSKKNGLSMLQRGKIAKLVNTSFRNWAPSAGGQNIDLRELLESFEEIDKIEWNDFIALITETKEHNGNNDQTIADQVLVIANQWAQTVRFVK